MGPARLDALGGLIAPATMLEQLLDSLRSVPAAMPFVGPDQSALEHLLASMTAGVMS